MCDMVLGRAAYIFQNPVSHHRILDIRRLTSKFHPENSQMVVATVQNLFALYNYNRDSVMYLGTACKNMVS
jgi:hypothetical protein